jgi:predicted amidophosphoribosyltransferase
VDCLHLVPPLDSGICFRCGSPVAVPCRFCRQLDDEIRMARAAFPYMGWVGAATRSLKYGNEWSRADALGAMMVRQTRALGSIDVLVPVPLHPRRLAARGYNQSALLAQAIGVQTGLPVRPLLVRHRETQAQAMLNREERLENVAGAFLVDPAWAPAPGGRYLLVDDVRTTCATLNACALALRTTSPASIDVVTLALDIPRRELQGWLRDGGHRVP